MIELIIESNDMYEDNFCEKHLCYKKELKNGKIFENENIKFILTEKKIHIKHNTEEKKSLLILEELKYKKFQYETRYLKEKFSVYTNELKIYKKKIEADYKIFLNSELFNKVNLVITWKVR